MKAAACGMLAALLSTGLLLLAGMSWGSPAASGGKSLKPPQNVEVSIIDDNFTLKWNGSHESVRNVTFSADYKIPQVDNWIKLAGCQHITGSKCNPSLLDLNFYEEIEFRIRAEEENSTSSWYYVDSFIPFKKASLGPPGVHLEAEDKAITIHFFRPGKRDDSSVWEMETFLFSLVFWENSSHVENEIRTNHYIKKIHNLSPATTYCLKAQAILSVSRRAGVYSPVYCIKTTVEHKLPAPENVELGTQNQSYVLKWDYSERNVTFQVQCLRAFLKVIPSDSSGKWKQIPNCENIRTTYCIFPQSTFLHGIYFLRVQASDGNNTSFWSKETQVDTEVHSAILAPHVSVKPTSDSLRVFVGALQEPSSEFCQFISEVIFWKNTSNTERKHTTNGTDVTISNLEPLTLYCVKARLHFLQGKWNKTSAFSAVVCEETLPGTSSVTWVVIGICTLLLLLTVIFVVKTLHRCLNYVFFPALKPPCSIHENFSEHSFGNLLLSTSEEQTEKCLIIENVQNIIIEEETDEIDDDCKKYSSQTSEDSGNYSNEDEILESQTSDSFLQHKALSPGVRSGGLSCPGDLRWTD